MIAEREEYLPAVQEALPARDMRAGMAALAEMSSDEFEARLAGLKRGRERITRIHIELLEEGIDYGTIPGTPKPTLLKPGAEKLILFYGFAADFSEQVSYAPPGEGAPPITVISRCRIHLGDLNGPVVATGRGAANSWERKHRWRRGERHCPTCGLVGAIIRGKEELGGGWVCWNKKGGCGAKFIAADPVIVDQQVGDVEKPDAYDLLNTLVKMATKRSFVDAALRATATSGIFTQDTEEAPAPDAPRNAQEPRRARPELTMSKGKGQPSKAVAAVVAKLEKPAADAEAMTEKQRQGLRDLALERGETGKNWLPAIETVKSRGEGRTLLEGLRRLPVVQSPPAGEPRPEEKQREGEAMRAALAEEAALAA